MVKMGKKYKETIKKYDRFKKYTLENAIGLIKEMAYAGFDETIDIAIKLNIKKSHSIRDVVILPNSFQKEKRIVVFAKGEKVDEAKEAGAAFVGDQDLINKIKSGWLDFDIAIATPDMMRDVGKLGPILGRRGLMPNPKTQTVTNNIKEAIGEMKRGRVEFRADKTGVVHLPVGKISMDLEKIEENVNVVITGVKRKKPADIKGGYFISIAMSSTMGPGLKIEYKE